MEGESVIQVIRGVPTPEELAALVSVLLGRRAATVSAPPPSRWATGARPSRGAPGPDRWRSSGLPR